MFSYAGGFRVPRRNMLTRRQLRNFWNKVDKNDSCWNWTGARYPSGYGKVGLNGKTRLPHRIAYEIEHGPIPTGQQVDHRCHNTSCVNPEHLRLVTQKQNNENRQGKQRNNTTGEHGAYYDKRRNHWYATITHNGKQKRLGTFHTKAEAAEAHKRARLEMFTHNDQDRVA